MRMKRWRKWGEGSKVKRKKKGIRGRGWTDIEVREERGRKKKCRVFLTQSEEKEKVKEYPDHQTRK